MCSMLADRKKESCTRVLCGLVQWICGTGGQGRLEARAVVRAGRSAETREQRTEPRFGLMGGRGRGRPEARAQDTVQLPASDLPDRDLAGLAAVAG